MPNVNINHCCSQFEKRNTYHNTRWLVSTLSNPLGLAKFCLNGLVCLGAVREPSQDMPRHPQKPGNLPYWHTSNMMFSFAGQGVACTV
jgi:hypothetical protein